MLCPSCGAPAESTQKYCTECGRRLQAAATTTPDTTPTPAHGSPLPPPILLPPASAATTDGLEPTAAFRVVEQTSPEGHAPGWPAEPATGVLPAQTTGEAPVVAIAQPMRITPLLAVGVVAGALAVVSAFVTVASVEVTGAMSLANDAKLNDFSSNNTVAVIIAAVLMIGGAALGATGRRVGNGLAGGAGLALAGLTAWIVGVVTQVFDAQEVFLLDTGGSFTLTTTRDAGFWLLAAAGVLGLVAFALSLPSARPDGLPGLTPAIGVIGALGTLALVAGPLIPTNGGSFADNFSQDTVPPATLYLRLLVLLLIAVGGLVGFLSNRRWGSGLALGAVSIAAWQWITAITESGDLPVGPAGGNFFPDTDQPFAPHLVTTVGVVVTVLAVVVGLLAAAQSRRTR